MGAADAAQFGKAAQAGESDKLIDIVLVGTARVSIGDVGEPFELGPTRGELAELCRRGKRFSTATRFFAIWFAMPPMRHACAGSLLRGRQGREAGSSDQRGSGGRTTPS